MSYIVRVQLTNETDDEHIVQFSDFEDYPPDDMTFGEMFRAYQAEYGRCTSKVFNETKGGTVTQVGWHFVSRQRYEDSGEPYLRGAWVTVYREVEPARPQQLEYVDLGGR